MGLKDAVARLFIRSTGSKEQIENALKKELFSCSHQKYKVVDGKVRYWRIMRKDCYPNGCTSMDGNESFSINLPQNPLVKPTLLVPPHEFEEFIKNDLKNFINWQQKCQHRFLSFMGVLHAVKPRFDIKVTQRKEVTFRGFVLILKECMIGNTFFNDFAYVLISEQEQCQMNFSKTDTVSGVGFFSMNEKGMLVLSRPEKLKIIAKGIETEQTNKNISQNMEFRLVDPYIQDICELCPYSILVRVRKRIIRHSQKGIKHKSSRDFACTLSSCIFLEEKMSKLTADSNVKKIHEDIKTSFHEDEASETAAENKTEALPEVVKK